MTWQRRLAAVLALTVLVLVAAVAFAVVKDHHAGDCWPWQDRTDIGDGTLCDGKPHPHHWFG